MRAFILLLKFDLLCLNSTIALHHDNLENAGYNLLRLYQMFNIKRGGVCVNSLALKLIYVCYLQEYLILSTRILIFEILIGKKSCNFIFSY